MGAGYALPSAEAIAAGEEIAAEGIALEPVYTGKAMAALLADARRLGLKRVLFWCTVRGPLPAPDPAYQEKLPPALRRRLAPDYRPLVTRRRVMVSLAAIAAVGVAARITGYPEIEGFHGEVLATWEAHVIHAAAEALLPPAAGTGEIASIAARIDRYLAGMPAGVQRDVHAMLALVEQGTTLLGRRIHRFTRLAPAERGAFLDSLEARGGMLADASRGLRDLCMLALYQQPASWAALGYDGPHVAAGYDPRGKERMLWAAYESLVAPAGELPRSAR